MSKHQEQEELVTTLQKEENSLKKDLVSIKTDLEDTKAALAAQETDCELLKEQMKLVHRDYASTFTDSGIAEGEASRYSNIVSLKYMIKEVGTILKEKCLVLEEATKKNKEMQLAGEKNEQEILILKEELTKTETNVQEKSIQILESNKISILNQESITELQSEKTVLEGKNISLEKNLQDLQESNNSLQAEITSHQAIFARPLAGH